MRGALPAAIRTSSAVTRLNVPVPYEHVFIGGEKMKKRLTMRPMDMDGYIKAW